MLLIRVLMHFSELQVKSRFGGRTNLQKIDVYEDIINEIENTEDLKAYQK